MEVVVRMLPINTYEKFAESATMLLKAIDNLLAHPDEEKYRSLKLKNAKVKSAIVDTVGAVELLQAVGFKKRVDDFGVHALRISEPDQEGERTKKLEEVRGWLQEQLDAVRQSGKIGMMSDCVLQIKMTNALTYNAAFGAQETMAQVVEHVQNCSKMPMERRSEMVICANYPYREFVGDLLSQTVEEAGLMPRAQLFLKREAQENTKSDFAEDAIKKAERLREDRLKREKKVADKKKARADEKKQRENAIFAFQEDRAESFEKQQWKRRADEAHKKREADHLAAEQTKQLKALQPGTGTPGQQDPQTPSDSA